MIGSSKVCAIDCRASQLANPTGRRDEKCGTQDRACLRTKRGTAKRKPSKPLCSALPFPTLREVDLDVSLGLPDLNGGHQRTGLRHNAKMMVGFTGALEVSAATVKPIPTYRITNNVGNESDSSKRQSRHFTDYSSVRRGATPTQDARQEANRFLRISTRVLPGARMRRCHCNGNYLATSSTGRPTR